MSRLAPRQRHYAVTRAIIVVAALAIFAATAIGLAHVARLVWPA